MNKKSFWRGFGTGVLFASFILGVSCLVRTSDSETISRAKKLGMDFVTTKEQKAEHVSTDSPKQTSVADSTQAPATDETQTPNKTQKPKQTKEPETKATSKPTAQEKKKKQMEKEKEKMEENIKKAEKKLTINAGDWSNVVSQRLQDMGIIENAKDFDRYLTKNGYEDNITAGTFEVSEDDTYDELAKKITK